MSNREFKKLSDDELNWVREYHPALRVRDAGALLIGTLELCGRYEDLDGQQLELEDKYQVAIRFEYDNFPHVWETAERLQDRATRLQKDIMDMHVYPNTGGKVCMGLAPSIRRICSEDPTIQGVFHNLIIRYFYYHTYCETYNREPWRCLSHGVWGFCQGYPNNRSMGIIKYLEQCPYIPLIRLIIERGKIHANGECPLDCGRAKRCRCGAVKGFNALRKDYLSLPDVQKQKLDDFLTKVDNGGHFRPK